MPEVTSLRSRLRESECRYIVVKNRLALRAIEGQALDELRDMFSGPVAAAYSESDPVALAKALTEFAKDVPAIELKGGLVEGQKVDAAQIAEIASLPSREALLAKLVFLLQSPIVRFARSLNEIQRQFVAVLDQVRVKKEEQG